MKNIQLFAQILKNDLLSKIERKDLWDKAELKYEILDSLSEATAKYADIITLTENQRPQISISNVPTSPLEAAERNQIIEALKKTNWNRSHAAKILDIDRKTLYHKINRYGLTHESGMNDKG